MWTARAALRAAPAVGSVVLPEESIGQTPTHTHGDYVDAIKNRKAKVFLLAHETLGAFSPAAARHLRYLGREAAKHGVDATDYSRSYTASSFVPFYSQLICSASIMLGAEGIANGAKHALGKLILPSRLTLGEFLPGHLPGA